MFAKLCFLVLAMGASACVLLTVRQQRLDTVHDIAVIQKRIVEHDTAFAKLRADVAAQLLPQRIETLALRIGPLVPIGVDPSGPAVRAVAQAAAGSARTAPANARAARH